MAAQLLIATGNPGKMREYADLLRDIPFELVSLRDLGITHEVEETGETFEENAWLKRSEEHTSELQSRRKLVCRLLLEKKKVITHEKHQK